MITKAHLQHEYDDSAELEKLEKLVSGIIERTWSPPTETTESVVHLGLLFDGRTAYRRKYLPEIVDKLRAAGWKVAVDVSNPNITKLEVW